MRFLKVLFGFLILLLLFIAAWQNIPPILEHSITFRLNLYWIQWESRPIPIYLIIPLCFVAGILLMGLVDIFTIFRLRRKVRGLEKELDRLRPTTEETIESSLPESVSIGEEEDRGLEQSVGQA